MLSKEKILDIQKSSIGTETVESRTVLNFKSIDKTTNEIEILNRHR